MKSATRTRSLSILALAYLFLSLSFTIWLAFFLFNLSSPFSIFFSLSLYIYVFPTLSRPFPFLTIIIIFVYVMFIYVYSTRSVLCSTVLFLLNCCIATDMMKNFCFAFAGKTSYTRISLSHLHSTCEPHLPSTTATNIHTSKPNINNNNNNNNNNDPCSDLFILCNTQMSALFSCMFEFIPIGYLVIRKKSFSAPLFIVYIISVYLFIIRRNFHMFCSLFISFFSNGLQSPSRCSYILF